MWVNKVKQHTSQSIWEQKQLIHVWWSVTSCCRFSYCIPDVFGLQTDIHNFSKAVWHKGSSNNLWPSTKTHYSKCLLWWSYIKIKMTIYGTYMDSETLFNNYTAALGVWVPQAENYCYKLKSRPHGNRAIWQKFEVQKDQCTGHQLWLSMWHPPTHTLPHTTNHTFRHKLNFIHQNFVVT